MDERTFGAIAGNDVHAILTAFERGFPIIQAEAASRLFRSVTTEAVILDNRADVAGENDLIRCRGRQMQGIRVIIGANLHAPNAC